MHNENCTEKIVFLILNPGASVGNVLTEASGLFSDMERIQNTQGLICEKIRNQKGITGIIFVLMSLYKCVTKELM